VSHLRAYANKGDSDRAIEDASKALEIGPQIALAYNTGELNV
jgi:tetratricopeptide (TPR) repeat protein